MVPATPVALGVKKTNSAAGDADASCARLNTELYRWLGYASKRELSPLGGGQNSLDKFTGFLKEETPTGSKICSWKLKES